MEGIVVDVSVAMTWCYTDEHSDYADSVLDALENSQIVPSLWAVEIANALIVGERRRRLTAADIAHFLDLLDGLAIETDLETASRAMGVTRASARTHNLSAYDATYLEISHARGTAARDSGRAPQAGGIRSGLGGYDLVFGGGDNQGSLALPVS
jgi:predicted nucleic acid-binding protein